MLFTDIQVVFMEEEVSHNTQHPESSFSNTAITLEDVGQLELRLMKRINDLEDKLMARYDRIESLLATNVPNNDMGLSTNETSSMIIIASEKITADNSIKTRDDTDLKSVENQKPDSLLSFPKKEKTKSNINPEVVKVYESYESSCPNTFIQVVEMTEEDDFIEDDEYYDECIIEEKTALKPKHTETSYLPEFPIKDIQKLRVFNKDLQKEIVAEKLVRCLRKISGTDKEKIVEKFLRTVVSEHILAQSTWASKSYGKLRISNLTYLIKCFLRVGSIVLSNFSFEFFRAKTIELLQQIRIQHGLAPPKNIKTYRK